MMSSLLKRKEITYLHSWSKRASHKPLIIRGARQVGKSTLVYQFSKQSDLDLLTINFERNPEYIQAFSSKDPSKILGALHLLTGRAIKPNHTLLFLDEIQAAPEALVALRYFYEEMPELHVVAAGSLLEFTLAEAQFSMPVGRIEYLHLGVMQFEDFLVAMGRPELAEHLQTLSLNDITQAPMIAAIHAKYMALLREYWVVGGLPEAVASYAKAQDFTEVHRVQQSVVATYRDDFNKYSHGNLTSRIQLVFDQLPIMVGRKFKYSQVSKDHRAAELASALNQLCMARVAAKVHHTAANGVPLSAEVNHRFFKALYLDIGLMCAALNLNVLNLNKGDLSLVNNGALAEQFIGQHLLYSGAHYDAPVLHYWAREAKSAAAEIDYVMAYGQHIVPVEIKAGTSGSLKSLHQFLKEKQRSVALRFNADVASVLGDTKQLTDGSIVNYKLLSLPLYMVGQSSRLVASCLAVG